MTDIAGPLGSSIPHPQDRQRPSGAHTGNARRMSWALAIAGMSLAGCAHHGSAFNSAPASAVSSDNGNGSSTEHLAIGGSDLEVVFSRQTEPAEHERLIAWIRSAAAGLVSYFDHYPVKHVRIELMLEPGDEIHGTTYDGNLITMRVGTETRPADLADDWVLTHEMFHLAFPDMGEEHLWMNEGLSVYLEPIVRARLGIVSVDRYWSELIEGLPKGQPERGDRGLDHTHTWGRTYWGGTLFWFIADLRIREQTHNRKSLNDVIRAVLAAGGDGSQDWSVKRVIEVGDRATGTTVLQDIYAEMAPKAEPVDLGAIWRSLGIRYRDGSIAYDDDAPLAYVRKSMLERPAK